MFKTMVRAASIACAVMLITPAYAQIPGFPGYDQQAQQNYNQQLQLYNLQTQQDYQWQVQQQMQQRMIQEMQKNRECMARLANGWSPCPQ